MLAFATFFEGYRLRNRDNTLVWSILVFLLSFEHSKLFQFVFVFFKFVFIVLQKNKGVLN